LKNVRSDRAVSLGQFDTFDGSTTTMHFHRHHLAKPDDSLFAPPSGFKAYDSMQTMMQTEMMKKMGAWLAPGDYP